MGVLNNTKIDAVVAVEKRIALRDGNGLFLAVEPSGKKTGISIFKNKLKWLLSLQCFNSTCNSDHHQPIPTQKMLLGLNGGYPLSSP